MSEKSETVEGYVVDLACIRKYPHGELLERARSHTKECALMGHCVESGYGLVGEDGRLYALDVGATPKVVGALETSAKDRGIRLRAVRGIDDKEMVTRTIDEI